MSVFTRMKLVQGDITGEDVHAIVNAANKSLLGGGGVDGAIHRAAGPKLVAECRTLGGCETGDAKLTKGYGLKAGHVIHTVGPVYRGRPQDPRLLASCYKASLELARRYNLQTIAFPAISCGVYGYPINAACKIAIDTTLLFIKENQSITNVIFALFSQKDLMVYRKYLSRLSPQTIMKIQT